MSSDDTDMILDGRFANATGKKVITKKSGEEDLRKCRYVHEYFGPSIPPAPLPEPDSSSPLTSKSWSPSWASNDDNNLSVPSAPAAAAAHNGRTPRLPIPGPMRILPRSTPANPPNNGQLKDFSVPKLPSPGKEDVYTVQPQPLKPPPRDVAADDLSLASSHSSSIGAKRPKKYANYGGMRFEVVGDDDCPSPAQPKENVGLKRRTRVRPLGATPPHVEEIRKEYTPFAEMKARECESERKAGLPDQYGVPKDQGRIWRWMDHIPEETEKGVDWEIVVEREKVERLWRG